MHPVRAYRYDPAKSLCVHVSTDETEGLEYAHKTDFGFSYCALFNEAQHPQLWAREGHVLPKLGVEVSRFGYREAYRPENPFDYYVDVISVPEQGGLWTVRDLYLDVLVYEGERVKILDTDEYLEALKEGHFLAGEAAHALEKAHAFVNGLAQRGYELDAFLQAEGVTLTWHRLRSTR